MQSRIACKRKAPQVMQTMGQMEKYVDLGGLEPSLQELVWLPASQINGCAYCIDLHPRNARARGETGPRLYELRAWREMPFYTDRERASLAWAEAVPRVPDGQAPDDRYALARTQFSERERVDLDLAVIAINGCNWPAISVRTVPGTYHPAHG